MSDNLGRKLDALSQRLPDGSPNVGAVVAAGRRLKRRRLVVATAGMLAVISLSVLAATSLDLGLRERTPVQPATHDDGVFEPAEDGEPTYVLYDFEISRRYVDKDCMKRQDNSSICGSSSMVGFSYKWKWSTKRYPGMAQCRVIVFDDDGRELGREVWELSGLEPSSRNRDTIPVDNRFGRPPSSAEAQCEAGTYEAGPGYRFTFVGSETYGGSPSVLPERIRLLFDLEILVEHEPFTNTCTLRVRFENGDTKTSSFTLTGPQEGPYHMDTGFPASNPVESASLECEEFTGESSRQPNTADDYRQVAREGDTRVYAPSHRQPFGWCPQNAQQLTAADLSGAEEAVLLAKDEITGSGLTTEDAYTDSVLASEASGPPDFARMITRDCPSSLVLETALVGLHLPKVDSASMSAATYFVSKEPRGWVIWHVW